MPVKNSHTQIIIAALNEEQGIAYTISDLKKYFDDPKIIVVDGNSGDKTALVAKVLGAEIILQKGKGKGDALNLGLKKIGTKTKYIVLIDADYTYPAKFIPHMIDILEQNSQVGMVCGNRFNDLFSLKSMNRVFYSGNKLISIVHSVLNGINLKDPLTGLRVVRADLLRAWVPQSLDFDIEVELNNYIEKNGFQIYEVPISYRVRVGEKKLKMKHGAVIFGRILYEFFK